MDIKKILTNHKHWLAQDCENWDNMQAVLRGADLHGVDLHGANLRDADLCDANLRDADLRWADLSESNLYGACLHGANLYGADLYDANLRGTDLSDTNFCEANLRETYLDRTEEIRKGMILTEPLEGWKKCKNDILVRLEVPRGAIVFSINNKICRTNKVIVKEIYGGTRAYSIFKFLSYYVGDMISVYDFDCQYNVECGAGINFFKTREEAENY